MKILVTGGAGFIGSNLVRHLVKLGHSPIVLDDLSSGYEANLLPGVPFIRGDICDMPTVRAAITNCTHVFHLAAQVGNALSIANPVGSIQNNILGTLNVLDAAREQGINVTFSSSASIFGEPQTSAIDESHPVCPDSPYGITKLAAEQLCLVYNQLYGMRNACLRYFNVYGINQRYDEYGNAIPIFAERLRRNESITVFGDGNQTRDFVNVKDVVAANLLCMDQAGTFNVGSGECVTINHLIQMMQDIADRQTTIRHADPRPGEVHDSRAEITKLKGLGYAPQVPLGKGLREYLDWMLK